MFKKSVSALAFILSLSVLFTSCDRLYKNTNTGTQGKYLVSYKQVKVISQIEINTIFQYLKTLYPETDTLLQIAKKGNGVRVFSITYKTSFMGDTSVVASGLVCAPIGGDVYPLVSFQNGTYVLHADAPSVNPDLELYQFLEVTAATGFVIAIPDYIGFGSTSDTFHPYLDKESTVQCVIDMLRATKELMQKNDLNVNISNDLYITGYSMGGWATLQLQKAIETDYPDEFNLKASACAAGPYDLLYINNYILNLDNYPMPYFIAYMLNSYTRLGDITNPLSDIINEPYASLIPTLFDGTIDSDSINARLTTSVAGLFTPAYITGSQSDPKFSSVRQTLLKNSIQAWNISTPLLLLHGEADDFVPEQVTENIYNNFINLGVSPAMIRLTTFPGLGHTEAIVPSGIASFLWFLQIQAAS